MQGVRGFDQHRSTTACLPLPGRFVESEAWKHYSETGKMRWREFATREWKICWQIVGGQCGVHADGPICIPACSSTMLHRSSAPRPFVCSTQVCQRVGAGSRHCQHAAGHAGTERSGHRQCIGQCGAAAGAEVGWGERHCMLLSSACGQHLLVLLLWILALLRCSERCRVACAATQCAAPTPCACRTAAQWP